MSACQRPPASTSTTARRRRSSSRRRLSREKSRLYANGWRRTLTFAPSSIALSSCQRRRRGLRRRRAEAETERCRRRSMRSPWQPWTSSLAGVSGGSHDSSVTRRRRRDRVPGRRGGRGAAALLPADDPRAHEDPCHPPSALAKDAALPLRSRGAGGVAQHRRRARDDRAPRRRSDRPDRSEARDAPAGGIRARKAMSHTPRNFASRTSEPGLRRASGLAREHQRATRYAIDPRD